jgi:hypothetical protein
MSRPRVPQTLRDLVSATAGSRCGYCLASERFGVAMEIDHIIPVALGGPTSEENLWLACRECNARKGSRVTARDPQTGRDAHIFNPRRQVWSDHFAWSPPGDRLIGQSPTGRATIDALDLNGRKRVVARQLWVEAGWHPPSD